MAASGKGDGQVLNAGKKRARKRTAEQAALEPTDSSSTELMTSPESTKQIAGRKIAAKKKVKVEEESQSNDTINDTIDSVIKHSSPAKESPQKASPKKKVARRKPVAVVKEPLEDGDHPSDGTHGHEEMATEDAPEPASEHVAISPDDEIWTTESVKLLLERIKGELPKEDKSKYSTQSEKMDWETIKFDHFTSEDCKHKWNAIVLRLRRFRTMTDLVLDAEEWAKVPWSWFGKKKVHPDMPRRPLSPYLRFFMERVPKFRKDYPKLAITSIAKMIAEKFKALPAKKKQKYTDAFNIENEKYKVTLEKFKEEHPEICRSRGPEKAKKKAEKEKVEEEKAPPKPISAQQLFVNSKLEEIMISQPQLTKVEASQELKKKWSTLKESKKMKYINMALEGQKEYQKHMDEYCKDHPDFQPKRYRAVITKAEEKVRDHHFGKPEKPPNSGYAYFSSTLLSQLTDIPSVNRMGEISRRWKALSDKEKEKFNKTAEQKLKAYKIQYEKYRSSLPEEERQRLEKEEADKASKKTPKHNGVVPTMQNMGPRPKRPMSALFMFINEKKDKFKQRYPNISNQDIVRLLSKAYSELPESKREKYKKKEMEVKESYEQELHEYLKQHPEAKSGKENNKMRYPGEPKKPPGSGYQLFSAEMMGKLTDIPSKFRLQEVSARWKNLSEMDRVSYNQRRVQMVDDYRKLVEKFKAGLSLEERTAYEEMVSQRGRKMNNSKGNNKKPTVKKEEVPVQEEESESGEEEESDDEEGSSSEEEGSEEDAGSGEEEGSEEESSDEEDDEEEEEETEQTTTTTSLNNNTSSIPAKTENSSEPEANVILKTKGESSSESESESDSESSSSGESSSEEGESE